MKIIAILIVILMQLIFIPVPKSYAATAVDLRTADSFAVLAGAGITNTGTTTITGDVGSYPTTTQTGFGTVTITGTNHAGDATTQGAKTDLVTAYNDAAGQTPATTIVGDLGGQTFTAGVYNSGSSIGLTGTVTLNGQGDPNAVFIFQAGSTLTTASSSNVVLTNSAQSCNVFWQVGSDATLGTSSTFRGTIIALTSITVTTSATIDGRVLARNGAVTLDTNSIIKPTCIVPTSTPTPTPTPTPTLTPTPTPTPTLTPTPTSASSGGSSSNSTSGSGGGDGRSDGMSDGRSDGLSSGVGGTIVMGPSPGFPNRGNPLIPGFPNTGIGPSNNNILIEIFAGVFTILAIICLARLIRRNHE